MPGRRKTKERPGRRGGLNGISLKEIEKIYSEIFVLEAQKKKYEIISEFSEANMCQSIIDHLMELITIKKKELIKDER